MDQIATYLVERNLDQIPVAITKKIQMIILPKEDSKRQILKARNLLQVSSSLIHQ